MTDLHAVAAPSGLFTPPERIALSLRSGQYGTWEWVPSTAEFVCDDYLAQLFGGVAPSTLDEFLALVGDADRAEAASVLGAATASGQVVDIECRLDSEPAPQRAVRIVGQPIDEATPRRFAGVVVDVTDRHRAQVRLDFLSRAGELLGSSLDLDTTLQQLCDLAIEQLADWCSVDLYDGRDVKLVAVSHRDPAMIRYARELRERFGVNLDTDSGLGKVLRTGEPDIIPTIDEALIREALAAIPDIMPDDVEQFLALGLRSSLVVPLRSPAGRVIGALSLVSATPGRTYGAPDVDLAMEVARRAATAVENAALYARVEHAALTLQRSLLPPTLPQLGFAELAAHYRPLIGTGAHGEALIGGDFYDVFPTADGHWAVLIGDVSGKGVDAAALTAAARWTLRTSLSRTGSPAQALEELNLGLAGEDLGERYLTVLAAVLEPRSDGIRVTYASGGHLPPIVLRDGCRVEVLPVDGMVVGAFPTVGAGTFHVELSPGDSVVLFTDGVTETRSDSGLFGEYGVRRALEASEKPLHCAQQIVTALVDVVTGFGTPRDDMAVLTITVPPTA